MRLKLTNGSSAALLQAAISAPIAGGVPPYGTSGSRVAWSRTSSSAQKTPSAADLADDRVALGELAQAGPEDVLADAVGVLDDALVLHRVDRRDGGGAGQRVAGVGEAAGEGPVAKVA